MLTRRSASPHTRTMRPDLRALIVSCLAACGDSTNADGGPPPEPTTGGVAPTTGSLAPTSSVGADTTLATSSGGSSSTGEPVTSTSSATTTTDETTTAATTTAATTTAETTATTEAGLCGLDPAPAGAISISSACGGGVPKDVVDPYNLVLEWKYVSPNAEYPGLISTPAVGLLRDDDGDGDVDGDDDTVIVVVERGAGIEGTLVVLGGDGSGPIFKVPSIMPAASPAIGDIDGDGAPDIVAVNQAKEIVAIDNTGAIKWVSVPFEEAWLQTSNILADLDEDGDVEVLSNDGIVDGKTGALIAPLAGDDMRAVVAADLDLDGHKEVIVERSVYSSTGVKLWTLGSGGANNLSAILNADADPEAEIYFQRETEASLYEHDGTLIWKRLLDMDVPIHNPALPCVADFDGDGEAEIGAPETGIFTMLDPDGTVLWKRDVEQYSIGGCAGYDVEGDGAYEVFHLDAERLWIFDGATGATLKSIGPLPGSAYRPPVIADVDNDGSAEILIAASSTQSHGLWVYGHATNGWSGAGRAWASHDYAVTNMNPDGSVPSHYEPPWLTHNLFRARPTVDPPRPDLAVRITATCIECTSEAQVAFQVCNQGGLDVAAGVPFTLYALDAMVEVPVETRMLPAVPAGECLAGDVFSFDPALVVDGKVVVRLHDDGLGTLPAHECGLINDRAAAVLTAC